MAVSYLACAIKTKKMIVHSAAPNCFLMMSLMTSLTDKTRTVQRFFSLTLTRSYVKSIENPTNQTNLKNNRGTT